MGCDKAGGGSDARWMALALSLGRRGLGQTWPNPAVGCVIVNQGRVAGRGWTQPGGRPHGETQALQQAGEKARGATAYVSLEPCAHQGQTPACANALVKAGIRRVVSAMPDPDPRVAGKGHAILRAAGVALTTGCLGDQAAFDHAGFVLRTTQNRPFVTLKLATSFDGRIATATGESQWITSAAARRQAHYLRATHDAVMVGSGTARADDPRLSVRGFGNTIRQPVRIICDTGLATSVTGALGRSAHDSPVWICHAPNAPKSALGRWEKAGAVLVQSAIAPNGHLAIDPLLATLGNRGLTRIFCEGGGTLAAALLAADRVDQLVGFTAGLALGADAIAAIARLPTTPLAAANRFALHECDTVGGDVLHIWRRVRGR